MIALTTTTAPGLRELDALDAETRRALDNSLVLRALPMPATTAEADAMLARLEQNKPNSARLAALAKRVEDGLVPATGADIGQHVAGLLGSYPGSTAPDPAVYSRMMVEEIKAVQPSQLALDSACRKLRRTLDWPPSIAAMLEALKDAETSWRFRARKLRELPEDHARITAVIRDTRDKVERIERDRSAQHRIERTEMSERQAGRKMGQGQ